MDRTRIRGRRWLLLALALGTGCAALSCASAQSAPADPPVAAPTAPPPRASPRPDQLEPGVDTTTPASGTAGGAGKPAAAPAAPASAAPGGAATRAAAAGPAAKVAAARPGKAKGTDRLELDTTDITGNRELPKVLYIVPWKRSDLGDLVGKPVNSLLDEMLQPLDRDVFQRENRYYDAVKPAQARPDAGAATAAGDKP